MSQDVLVGLARRVAADVSEQPRIEALADDELAEMGLDADEIQSIRSGFFDRVLWLGISAADDAPGCCTG
jgi:hypothetical protein